MSLRLLLAGLALLPLPADDWSQATKLFQAALAAGDDARLEQAALKIAADNSPRAVEFLAKAAKTAAPSPYWIIIAALSKVTQPAALDAMAEEALRGKVPELRRDIVMSFRLCESPSAAEPLMRLVREGPPELQVSALDELVDRGHLPVIPLLIDLAEKDPRDDKELNRRFFKALRALSKEDPPGGPPAWRAWWEKKNPDVKPDPAVPRKVGQTVVDTLRRTRLTDYEDLKKGKKEDILVIKGASDSVEDALFRLGVNYSVVSWERIQKSEDLGFGKQVAVFSNCGTGDWPPKQVERIRQYVLGGGYLCVTDLGMLQVVRLAFPGYLDLGKGRFAGMTVSILPWRGTTGHPFLRGVDIPLTTSISPGGRWTWELDPDTTAIAYDATKVVSLVESPDLLRKRKPSALAVVFSPGGDQRLCQEAVSVGGVYEELEQMNGKVLCLASHFTKQRMSEDGFTLHNLLINFLIEAKDKAIMRSARKEPKK